MPASLIKNSSVSAGVAANSVEPVITFSHDGTPGQGKASIWGTAYSGKVILFDDISLKYKKEK